MSIQSEIARINNNVAQTYSALEEKGASMPETQNSDNLAKTARSVSGGVSSWNDLTDKPFGEVGGRNTITIAANQGGFHNAGFDEWFKVSDVVVTESDINDESDLLWFSAGMYASWGQADTAFSLICTFESDFINVWALDMESGDMYVVAQFRQDGVYFRKVQGYSDAIYPIAITLAGFGKFTVNKPIDAKYLPDALRFGEVPGSNTWTKGGNIVENATDAFINYFSGALFCKISDAVVTMEDLAAGASLRYNMYGRIIENRTDDNTFGYYQMEDGVIDIPYTDENGNSMNAILCYPEGLAHDPGVYVAWNSDEDCVESFTINGFGKFTTTQKIDEKYLPDGIGGVSDEHIENKIYEVTDYIWEEIDKIEAALKSAGIWQSN